jgi:predicted protein tyrosine phosphatase
MSENKNKTIDNGKYRKFCRYTKLPGGNHMKEVYNNLFVGSDYDCRATSEHAIIHACKTCHQKVLNYRKSLPNTHTHYLIYEDGNHLLLNMVDMKQELMAKFTDPIMKAGLEFIDKHIDKLPVLIHCNQGMSRSPSIALLYLAIRGQLPTGNYNDASKAFTELYPQYNPGRGISLYLNNNWNKLVKEGEYNEQT